ncbi:GH25 family lysozyme [Paenarthrobacter nitroguajacolicus]|uniref:GH25 family lysozyme n=1 Tax=Paenarthrobacter nitroguajacolicus TaxID=211146 RepID=UPI00248B8D6F|nr:GH25 family lysozyme [Paenarthrobacter nitroguajacolicus]MDI2033007.1 hypothetical protein [Paenarthrobacter nitroguajacolicus]
MSYIWPLDATVPISVVGGIVRDFGSSPNDGINPAGGHTGDDYAAVIGTPVRAPGDGVIAFEGWVEGEYWQNPWWLDGKGGIVCVLDCGDNEPTFIMGHLSRTVVDKGQWVKKGDIIAYTGNTTTIPGGVGPHLHFEALPPGYILNGPTYGRVDPARYCAGYWADAAPDQTTTSSAFVFGIDVSMHQASIDISATGTRWVAIKATEGIGYADTALDSNLASARAAGVPVYFYHFARPTADNDATIEADCFVRNVQPRYQPGDGIVLDWEAENQDDTAWAKTWLDAASARLGLDAWIYMNTSTATTHDWAAVQAKYPLWQADYGPNTEHGFGTARTRPDAPGWNVAAWQYSSVGRLPGYAGDLDLNIIYRTENNMAITEADAKAIAHQLLIKEAWTGGPQVSLVLKALYEGFYVGGDSTVDGESLMTTLGKILTKSADPAAIAAAMPTALAQQVAAELGKRLQGEAA